MLRICKLILIISLAGFNINNYAQRVSDIKVNVSGLKTEIRYRLSDVSPNNYYYITLKVSTNGGKTFFKPSKTELSGDVLHKEDLTTGEKLIVWSKNMGKNVLAKITVEPFYAIDFKLTGIKVKSSDDKIFINYTVKGLDKRDDYFVILTVSEDDWKTDYEPNSLIGDVGELTNSSDGVKTIIWDVYKDKPEGLSTIDCKVRIMKRTSGTEEFYETLFGNRYVRSKLSGYTLGIGFSNVIFKSFYEKSHFYVGGEFGAIFFPVLVGANFYYGGSSESPNGMDTDTLLFAKWGVDIQIGLFPFLSGSVYPSFGVGYGQTYFEHSGSIKSSLVLSSFYAIGTLNILFSGYWRFSASYIFPFISEDYKKSSEIKIIIGYLY